MFIKAATFIKTHLIFLIICLLQLLCMVLSQNCVSSVSNEIRACSGDLLTLQCSALGAGITVWEGSAILECYGTNTNTISLSHSGYNLPDKPRRVCNNGAIVARAIGVDGNNYTSQLNVTVSAEVNNKTVECVHEFNFTTTALFSTVIIVHELHEGIKINHVNIFYINFLIYIQISLM